MPILKIYVGAKAMAIAFMGCPNLHLASVISRINFWRSFTRHVTIHVAGAH
jgi:hypothetical protein